MLLVATFSFFLIGVFGDDICEDLTPYERCVQFVPKEKVKAIDGVPDRDELLDICPEELKFLECFNNHLDDCGRGNEHFTVIRFFESAFGIAKELCNENSQLHKDYVNSAACYKSLHGIEDICEDNAKSVYETYHEQLKEQNPQRLEAMERSSLKICMLQSYKIACISENILSKCGEVASTVLMKIVSRSQYLRQFCSQSFVDELKTTFLNVLNLEEDQREIYKNFFSLIKK